VYHKAYMIGNVYVTVFNLFICQMMVIFFKSASYGDFRVSWSTAAFAPSLFCYGASPLSRVLIGLLVYGSFHGRISCEQTACSRGKMSCWQISIIENHIVFDTKLTRLNQMGGKIITKTIFIVFIFSIGIFLWKLVNLFRQSYCHYAIRGC